MDDARVAANAAELKAWLHDMWTHDCTTERARLSVERGEPCNWCGQHERT